MLISIIIPVYNEEKNLKLLHGELQKVCDNMDRECVFEFIFVDDGSADNSVKELKTLAGGDNRIKIIEFSRNFGKEVATTAGINMCGGDAAIMIDADLQHPIELIPEFIKKFKNGADIVIGIRQSNQGEGVVKKVGSYVFYKIINQIAEIKMIPNSTDYRLINRMVIDEFNHFTERNRITRGLIDWLGFNKDYIYFKAKERNDGKAGYSFLKLTKLAMSSFISSSFFPLKLAGHLGVVITFFSGLLGLFILVEKYILGDPWKMAFSGSAILAVIILFLIGIVLSCLGLIALYIANIHSEVANRPMYVVKKNRSRTN